MNLKYWKTKTINALLIFSFAPGALANSNIEVLFNTPGFSGRGTSTIHDKMVENVSKAVPGSTIRGSFYYLDHEPLAIELLRASARGVDVQLVMDGNTKTEKSKSRPMMDLLLNGNQQLAALKCSADKCIKFCQGLLKGISKAGGSCHGLAVNHNKFLLLSKLSDGSENVVMQTSANMTSGQMKMYQDLIIAKDENLYKSFSNYWLDLNGEKVPKAAKINTAGGDLQVQFFPQLFGKDPVVKLLEGISCHLPNSKIRIAQSVFTRGNVAERLRDLEKQGCDLKVIVRTDEKQSSPGKEILKELSAESLIILPFDREAGEDGVTNSIHAKIILIDAALKGQNERLKLVLTGSHNLDLFSLRANDEVLLYIKDSKIFDQYESFWNKILDDARASRLVP